MDDDDFAALCGLSVANMADAKEDEGVARSDLCLQVERAVIESNAQQIDAAIAAYEQVSEQDEPRLYAALRLGQWICQGQYAQVLRSERGAALLDALCSADRYEDREQTHIATQIAGSLDRVFQQSGEQDRLALAYEALFVGIALLNMFVQANYTGPAVDIATLQDVLDKLAKLMGVVEEDGPADLAALQQAALVWLQVDGEMPFTICEAPALLTVGRAVLSFVGNWTHANWSVAVEQLDERKADEDTAAKNTAVSQATREVLQRVQTAALWNARAAVVHARLLLASEPSATLWMEARRGFLQTQNNTRLLEFQRSEYFRARVLVEWGLAHHVFDKLKRGKQTFADALETSGLSVQLTGAMGKRTKFQRKSVAQMVLLAASKYAPEQATPSVYADAMANSTHVDFGGRKAEATEAGDADEKSADTTQMDEATQIEQLVQDGEASYRTVRLDQADADNILLEQTAFEDKAMTEQGNLQTIDQVVLLALCLDVKNSNANDGLTREQIFPYVTRVLENPNNWMVYSTALLERAWLECEMYKRRERGVLQMQALVDQHTARLTVLQNSLAAIEDAAPAEERMAFVYSLAFPPRYALKRDLAERYFALGVVRSAVELFLELEMWDDVVKCYQILDQPTKAEKLVRERLEIAPSPYMWTALGDITGELEHYETSWEISHHRYGRAKRSLGRAYFEKHEYPTAIKHYQDSTLVNPLNSSVWFTMGTMAIRLEDWQLGLTAFTRVVQLEPDNGEAWGNIGSIHLRQSRFAEAYSVLQEALKQKREMWQMWENYAFCALHVEKYGEAMYAIHQWLDLRQKHKRAVDHELLAWLVEAIVYPDAFKQARADAADEQDEEVVTSSEANLDEEDPEEDLGDLDEAALVTDRTPPLSGDNYKKQLAMLLGRITSIVTNNPKVWQVYAHFNDGVNRKDKALDCRLKQCRALQSANWETDAACVDALCSAAMRLAEDYKADGSKKALTACRMYLRGVLKKAQLDFAQTDACKALAETLEDVERLEQTVAAQQ